MTTTVPLYFYYHSPVPLFSPLLYPLGPQSPSSASTRSLVLFHNITLRWRPLSSSLVKVVYLSFPKSRIKIFIVYFVNKQLKKSAIPCFSGENPAAMQTGTSHRMQSTAPLIWVFLLLTATQYLLHQAHLDLKLTAAFTR